MSSFISVSLVATSLMCSISHGAIYYDSNGVILSGDTLIEMCYQNQVCNTHFAKNVYASSNPVLDHEWTPLLFPDMYDQFDSESACGSGSKFISMDTCAQVHSPMTLYHAEGEVKVSYVQEQYSLKWDNIRTSQENGEPIYDAFLDNTVAYWVDDISKYDSLWTEINADRVYLKWEIKNLKSKNNDELSGKTYYSLITHNGNKDSGSTLTQYELISDTFSGLNSDIESKMITSEQRMFFDELTDYRSFSVGCETVPIGARRAVSSIDDNVEWYKEIFSASILDEERQIIRDEYIDTNGNIVKYAHIKLHPSEESTTISFFERDLSSSTYGDFTVLDFEKTMTDTHNENMVSPYCGIDRWFDMHYAIDFDDASMSEEILQKLMKSGMKYTVYEEWQTQANSGSYPTFVYMTEPNGHSVQMVFDSSNDIEFLTNPQQWDATWCPMECTDEMLSYSYGDEIAKFSWDDVDPLGLGLSSDTEEDSDNTSDSDSTSSLVATITSLYNNQSSFNLLFLILGSLGVLLIGIMIGCNYYPPTACGRFKYEKLPQ